MLATVVVLACLQRNQPGKFLLPDQLKPQLPLHTQVGAPASAVPAVSPAAAIAAIPAIASPTTAVRPASW